MTHAIQYMRLDVHGWISGTNIVNCNPIHEAGYFKTSIDKCNPVHEAGYSEQALSNAIQYMRLDIQNEHYQIAHGPNWTADGSSNGNTTDNGKKP